MAVFERDPELLRLLRPPRLRTLDDGERHASYLELFFDLVFVVAIAQLAHELVLDHSLAGFGVFAGLFLPVFVPVVFAALTTGVLVLLVGFKLWTAHREAATSASGAAPAVEA